MMQEVWKDIPEYEGIYQASNLGRIRTAEGKTTKTKRHGERHWKSRVLKTRGKQMSGYRVSLWKDGNSKDFLVARLVALTFLGEPLNKDYTVNHKDGNRFNNNINNLEWLTRAENIQYGFANNQYPQKAVAVIDNNKNVYEFRSLAECSRFLKRSVGYVSNTLKQGRKFLKSADGFIYELF